MKIVCLANSGVAAVTRGQDLWTVSKAHLIPAITASAKLPVGTDYRYYYIETFAQGQSVFDLSAPIAGTSQPEISMSPSFFPVSTKGAECGAIVEWRDPALFREWHLQLHDE
jgi:hypothetical protein